MLALDLGIDLDALGGIIDDSMPWLEAWLAVLAIILVASVAILIITAIRQRRSPVSGFINGSRRR